MIHSFFDGWNIREDFVEAGRSIEKHLFHFTPVGTQRRFQFLTRRYAESAGPRGLVFRGRLSEEYGFVFDYVSKQIDIRESRSGFFPL